MPETDLPLPLKATGERADWMIIPARYLNTVPLVHEGDEVWCRCPNGLIVRRIARSGPACRLQWYVQVSDLDEWRRDGDRAAAVAWPASDVVPGSEPAPGPLQTMLGE
jgi:hypothetical protein